MLLGNIIRSQTAIPHARTKDSKDEEEEKKGKNNAWIRGERDRVVRAIF